MDYRFLQGIAIVTAAVGLLVSQGLLIWLGLMLFVLERGSFWWAQNALVDLSYHRSLSARKVFVGDPVTVTVTVENDKPLPVAWLLAEEDVSSGFAEGPGLTRRYGLNRDMIVHLFSLGWFERVIRTQELVPSRRGVLELGHIALEAGDPFGFHRIQGKREERLELLVYPQLRPLESWDLHETSVMGMVTRRRFTLVDPLNIIASRQYRPGDPMRHINWKSTARRGTLMTNVLAPTTEPTAAIILDVRTYENIWEGSDRELSEEAISVAGSLAARFNNRDIPFSFYTNGFVTHGHDNQVDVGRGTAHLADTLEVLARVNSFTRVDITQVVRSYRELVDPGLTVFVVTPRLTDDLRESLDELTRHGVENLALLVQDRAPSGEAGKPQVDSAQPSEEARQFEVVPVNVGGEARGDSTAVSGTVQH